MTPRWLKNDRSLVSSFDVATYAGWRATWRRRVRARVSAIWLQIVRLVEETL